MKHFIIAAEIYLAGGCFWGTEHFLKQIRGVESTEVGYANSIINQPTYQQVCSGETNAAETVKVVYDPETVNLSLLLDLYFKTIDPTSLNRQGNDRGTQYRTGIYYTNKADIAVINQAVRALADQYKNPEWELLLIGRPCSPPSACGGHAPDRSNGSGKSGAN